MLNRITLQGRFVKDPELRRSKNGDAITTFNLAVERDFKDKQTGERGADFISCVAYKSSAEMISRFFVKGSMAIVDGRLQIRKWQNKEGENRYFTEVIVNTIYFVENKKEKQQDNSEIYEEPKFEEISDDGDLPF